MSDYPSYESVRQRSAQGSLSCAVCWIAWRSGNYACPSHATPEERTIVERRISELSLREHPVFAFVRRDDSFDRFELEPVVPLKRKP